MAYTVVTNTRGNLKCSSFVLDAGDDTLTLDSAMKSFRVTAPLANLVTMYMANTSSGKGGTVIHAATSQYFNHCDLAGRVVCFVGTNGQTITIAEELAASPT